MTYADANYLLGHVFTKEFIEEIQKRGYDISTLKFEISPKFPTPRPEKFGTFDKKYSNHKNLES